MAVGRHRWEAGQGGQERRYGGGGGCIREEGGWRLATILESCALSLCLRERERIQEHERKRKTKETSGDEKRLLVPTVNELRKRLISPIIQVKGNSQSLCDMFSVIREYTICS